MHVLRMQSSAHDLRHRFQDLNFTAGQLYALIKSHVLNVSTIGKYLQLAVCVSASRCGCTLVHSQVRTAQSRHQSQMAATHALTTFPVSSASSEWSCLGAPSLGRCTQMPPRAGSCPWPPRKPSTRATTFSGSWKGARCPQPWNVTSTAPGTPAITGPCSRTHGMIVLQ